MIPEDILTALIIALIFFVPAFLWLRWMGRKLAAMRVRTIEDDSGDQGGMPEPVESSRADARPRAPDTGSGLRFGAGDTTSTWRPSLHFPTSRRDERRAGDMLIEKDNGF